MPHYHTEGFANTWELIRETATSQKWKVVTEFKALNLEVDIHYTPSRILTATIIVQGESSKAVLTSVMDDIGRLGLYRGDYAVIDATLVDTAKINQINYSVDEKDREHRNLELKARPTARRLVPSKRPAK